MLLEFEPEGHVYRIDGKVRRSITQILNIMGFINSDYFTEGARIRGQRVHSATAMMESPEGLDPWSLRPIERALGEFIIPRVRAWRNFLRDTGWVSDEIEAPQYHKLHLVPGTIDRIGKFPKGRKTIAEIKTCGHEPWHCLQTGAQQKIWESHTGEVYDRIGVSLFANGKYKVTPHDNAADGNDFLSIMAACRAGESRGYFKTKKEA